MEKIAARAPVDKTAALVVSRGVHFEPKNVKKRAFTIRSKNALPTVNPRGRRDLEKSTGWENLTGRKYGRLTVVGLFDMGDNRAGLWVVKCCCGNYETRNKKQILNTRGYRSHATDACDECRHMNLLKRGR